ncbi:unnamed protein product [Rotaria sordida]|uniref:Uncharacterized protein n=1 Tax=Rotaria sordida TaxID=392033 RepID=A0A816DDT3_9BILA|nr:unnamed protein product [Rotaria sordida]CAF1633419.1 unnamed protein product [Rotaria sordida]
MQRPSLIDDDDDDHTNNKSGKQLLSRSLTFDSEPLKQKRIKRLSRPSPTIIEQQSQCLSRSLLSNDNWWQETMADVRVNAKVIEQSIDSLPCVHEMLNELSNTKAFLYARQCRVVIAKLRLCWSDVNEEIKSLLKHKEYTEATIEHIRKDLIKLDEVRQRVTKIGTEQSVVTDLIYQCLINASRTFELARFEK